METQRESWLTWYRLFGAAIFIVGMYIKSQNPELNWLHQNAIILVGLCVGLGDFIMGPFMVALGMFGLISFCVGLLFVLGLIPPGLSLSVAMQFFVGVVMMCLGGQMAWLSVTHAY